MDSRQNPMELQPPSEMATGEPPIDHHRPMGTNVKERKYVPPNGGYGWVCVVCVFLINAHTWGLNFVSFLSQHLCMSSTCVV